MKSHEKGILILLGAVLLINVYAEKNDVNQKLAEAPAAVKVVVKGATNSSLILNVECKLGAYNLTISPKEIDNCYKECKTKQFDLIQQTKCELVIPNLCSNSIYTITVNKKETLTYRTLKSEPSEATNIRELSKTATTVTLSWTLSKCPSINSNLNYRVDYWKSSEDETKSFAINIPEKSLDQNKALITNLDSSTEYSFRVQSCVVGNTKLCTKSLITNVKTEFQIPSAPLDVTVTGLTRESISIIWKAPKITGNNLNYKVTCSLIKNPKVEDYVQANDSKNRKHNCTGLKPYTKYFIGVISTVTLPDDVKKIVHSESSKLIESITAVSEPSAIILTGTQPTSTSLRIEWKKPKEANGPIDFYSIKVINESAKISKDAKTKELFITVNDLKPFFTYQVIVNAVNVLNGKNLISKNDEKVLAETAAAKPSAITDLKKESMNDSSITIVWKSPSQPNGPLNGYIVEYKPSDSVKQGDPKPKLDIVQVKTTSLTASGLLPWRNYTFSVVAFNQLASGKLIGPKTDITIETGIAAPNTPKDVQISFRNSGKLLVTWKRPVPVTGPTWYNLETEEGTPDKKSKCQNPGSVIWKKTTTKIEDWTLESYDDIKWIVDKCYRATLTAITVKGQKTSQSSSILSSINRTAHPSVPTNFKVDLVTEKSIKVSWGRPLTPETGALLYRVKCTETKTGGIFVPTNNSTMNHVCDNLKPYLKYYVTLFAVKIDDIDKSEIIGDSIVIDNTTKASVPSKPKLTNIVDITYFTIEIFWEKPEFKNGPIDFYTVSASDNSGIAKVGKVKNHTVLSYRISGLKPDTNYTITVSATNIVDGKELESKIDIKYKLTLVAEPSDINNLFVSNQTSSSVSLKWFHLVSPERPLDGYIITSEASLEIGDLPRSDTEIIINSKIDTYTFDKLLAWRNYTFTVQAFNTVHGGFRNSSKISITTRTNISAPSQPLNVILTNEETGFSIVSWDRPLPMSGPTRYEIVYGMATAHPKNKCDKESDLKWISRTFKDELNDWSIKSFKGLPNWNGGNCYRVTVTAVTATGIATSATAFTNTIDLFPKPSQPRNLKSSSKSSDSITINWAAPEPSNGIKLSYQVKCDNTAAGSAMFVDADDNIKMTHNFKKLKPYTTYFITVRATFLNPNNQNKIEGFETKPSLKVITKAAAPGQVQKLSATNVKSTTVDLTWAKPIPANGPINYYTIERYSTSRIEIVNQSQISMKLENLEPNTEYTVIVKAVNTLDKQDLIGPPSSTKFTTTISDVPLPLKNLTIISVDVTSAQIFIPAQLFKKALSNITQYLLIIGPQAMIKPGGRKGKPNDDRITATYNSTVTKPYKISNTTWNPEYINKRNDSLNCIEKTLNKVKGQSCTLGFQKNCAGIAICNGPLTKSFQYGVKIRAYSSDGWSETFSSEFKTKSNACSKSPSFLIFFFLSYVIYKNQ